MILLFACFFGKCANQTRCLVLKKSSYENTHRMPLNIKMVIHFLQLFLCLSLVPIGLADNQRLLSSINLQQQYRSVSALSVNQSDGSIYIAGQQDDRQAFLAKLSPTGERLWSANFGNRSSITDMTLSANSNNIFVTGWTRGSFAGQNILSTSPQPINSNTFAAMSRRWRDVIWVPEFSLFIALTDETGSTVITSPNGLDWTVRSAEFKNWQRLAWSPQLGIVVAVGTGGSNLDRVFTSYDAINWTLRTAAMNVSWTGVCWSPELGIFVAVGSGRTDTSLVMTSPNGIDWNARLAAAVSTWTAVAWAKELGLFVALSAGWQDPARVMVSFDGVNWVLPNSAPFGLWCDISWSRELGLFVAVANAGTNRIMTSPNGFEWTSRMNNSGPLMEGVAWASDIGLFAAVSWDGRTLISSDGINWAETPRNTSHGYFAICWSPELGVFAYAGVNIIGYWKPFPTELGMLSKFTSQGSMEWTRFYEGSVANISSIQLNSIAASLADGDLILAGSERLNDSSRLNAHLMRVKATDGAVVWRSSGDNQGTASRKLVAVDVDNTQSDIFSTGSTDASLDGQTFFGGGSDILIQRHSLLNGSRLQTKLIGSPGSDFGSDISVSRDRSAVYVVGSVGGLLPGYTMTAFAANQIIVRLNYNDLSIDWVKIIGTMGLQESATKLAVHPSMGTIYVLGFIEGRFPANQSLSSSFYGSRDITLTAFRPNGTLYDSLVLGSELSDNPLAMDFNYNGSVHFLALFQATYRLLNYDSGFNASTPDPDGPLVKTIKVNEGIITVFPSNGNNEKVERSDDLTIFIIAAAVGGAALLIIFATTVFFLVRKNKKDKEILMRNATKSWRMSHQPVPLLSANSQLYSDYNGGNGPSLAQIPLSQIVTSENTQQQETQKTARSTFYSASGFDGNQKYMATNLSN